MCISEFLFSLYWFQTMAPRFRKNLWMKKYRGRLNSEPQKSKEHSEQKNKTKTMIVNEEKPQEEEEKIRQRARAHQDRKKERVGSEVKNLETEFPFGSFKCSQSFGKAVSEVKKVQPRSPSKNAVVVRKLALDFVGAGLFKMVKLQG